MRSLKYLTLALIVTTWVTSALGLTAVEEKLVGTWQGGLNIGAVSLRLVVHFAETGDHLTATLDSPDQGARDIPIDTVIVRGDSLQLVLFSLGAGFEGAYHASGDSISGTWKQGGMQQPFSLTKSAALIELIRPQEPEPPFPYTVEEVTFYNAHDSITLAGSLTYPESGAPFPAVVLISGSGPQNRDEEVFAHKPFMVVADHLSRRGIAVLRFDDRGIGESQGDFVTATSEDFASDVGAAVAYLKTRKVIDATKIGLIGHSEGGTIAPMVAVENSDVGFIILLAGTGVPGTEVIALQEQRIMEAAGIPDSDVAEVAAETSKLLAIATSKASAIDKRTALIDHMEMRRSSIPEEQWAEERLSDVMIAAAVEQFMSPWMQFFLTYDPALALKRITCPVLALNGELDLQVIPEQNLPAIEASLKTAGNTAYKIVELENLNHLFQHAETGHPTEYSRLEETFAPEALELMAEWIQEVVK